MRRGRTYTEPQWSSIRSYPKLHRGSCGCCFFLEKSSGVPRKNLRGPPKPRNGRRATATATAVRRLSQHTSQTNVEGRAGALAAELSLGSVQLDVGSGDQKHQSASAFVASSRLGLVALVALVSLGLFHCLVSLPCVLISGFPGGFFVSPFQPICFLVLFHAALG